MMNVDHDSITTSSGNIFADLNMENPEELSVKSQLASKIYDRIEENGWTQAQAAIQLGISQPDVSRLTRGMLRDFPISRLRLLLWTIRFR